MRIALIRHGRQSDTRCNVDVGLSPEGRRQAELLGTRLAGSGVDAVIASDMIRARETAEILASPLGLPVEVIPALRELDFGDLEGLDDDRIAADFATFRARQARMEEDLRYPGGETIGELSGRVLEVLADIATRDQDHVAVVTHGVAIRAVLSRILHLPLPRWRTLAPGLENGSITELSHDPGHGFRLDRLNDHAHLENHRDLLRAAWGVQEN